MYNHYQCQSILNADSYSILQESKHILFCIFWCSKEKTRKNTSMSNSLWLNTLNWFSKTRIDIRLLHCICKLQYYLYNGENRCFTSCTRQLLIDNSAPTAKNIFQEHTTMILRSLIILKISWRLGPSTEPSSMEMLVLIL